MAKANIHTASRDDLVHAGLTADIADEIVKLRRESEITNVEALEQLPGVGPATVERLRNALDFRAPERRQEKRAQADADNGAAAESGTTAARSVLRMAHQRAKETDEFRHEAIIRSSEGLAELNRAFFDLLREQARQNLEIWTILPRSLRWDEALTLVDWRKFADLQIQATRDNLERTTELTRRCFELGQSMADLVASGERDSERAA